MEKGHKIAKILPGSIGEELELEVGDLILAVNNQTVEDVFDYQFLINDEYIELSVLKKNGEEWILEIDKDEDEKKFNKYKYVRTYLKGFINGKDIPINEHIFNTINEYIK